VLRARPQVPLRKPERLPASELAFQKDRQQSVPQPEPLALLHWTEPQEQDSQPGSRELPKEQVLQPALPLESMRERQKCHRPPAQQLVALGRVEQVPGLVLQPLRTDLP
jgi:hypothetical protein